MHPANRVAGAFEVLLDAVVIDEDVLAILPTLYGIGRCDRTLEIAPADLVRLTGARVASLSRPGDRAPRERSRR